MSLTVQNVLLGSLNKEAAVVFIAKKTGSSAKTKNKAKNSQIVAKGISTSLQEKIQTAVKNEAFSGKLNESLFFRLGDFSGFDHLLILGIGDEKAVSLEGIRRVSGAAVKKLRAEKVKTAGLSFESLSPYFKKPEEAAQAVAEGIGLGSYVFDSLKSKGKIGNKTDEFCLFGKKLGANVKKSVEAGNTLAEATNLARFLGDSPGNHMTPTILASETQKAAKGTKLKVTIWDKTRIQKEQMNSFLSVAAGTDQPPKFIAMEYKNGPAGKKPVCFVGKGLTFDCGGISIKPSASMEEMKYDMCGGAAVIGTMIAIARLKLKINAIAFVPATENLTGGSATKPGDVVAARNKKTIEINNTDAEGRLILADALVWASEKKPAFIVDAATLTGAMVMALGNIHTGVFTRNENMMKQIESAAKTTGEKIWQMPLTDEHVEDMQGTYADLSNISKSRGAGSATAAAFLEQFVAKGIPWAHFDIAGTAWNCSNRIPYFNPKGATGVMVRTFVELAKNYK